jgi:hypothetical protein
MDEQRSDRGGYGRNWKKWLLIYAVAGAVIYLIVYFVFFHSSGGYGGSSGGSSGGGGGGYWVIALPAALDDLRSRWRRST